MVIDDPDTIAEIAAVFACCERAMVADDMTLIDALLRASGRLAARPRKRRDG